MQLSGAEEESGEEEPREQQDGGIVDSVLSVPRGASCPHSGASRPACVHGCFCAVSGEIEDDVWANEVSATRRCRTGRRDRPRHPSQAGLVSHRSLDAASRPALSDLLALTVPQDPGAIISVSAVPDQTTGRGYQDRSAWDWQGISGNEIKCGTCPNRPCACCGSAFEDVQCSGICHTEINRIRCGQRCGLGRGHRGIHCCQGCLLHPEPRGLPPLLAVFLEHCHRCRREPLCASCSNLCQQRHGEFS